jgi:hypothetical protein
MESVSESNLRILVRAIKDSLANPLCNVKWVKKQRFSDEPRVKIILADGTSSVELPYKDFNNIAKRTKHHFPMLGDNVVI